MKIRMGALAPALCLAAMSAWAMKPVTLVDQGSLLAGGTVVPATAEYDPRHPQSAAQTLHGDHAYAEYQIPQNSRPLPIVMLHGAGQSAKTWDTTPDGRDGFRNLFLSDRYAVYLVDQPRRGRAGRGTVAGNIAAAPDEAFWFGQFRLGLWPRQNAETAFPGGDAVLDQFMRQMTPNTAPYDEKVNAAALSAVLAKAGRSVFFTHSQGCGVGWLTALESDEIAGIAAFEPGSGFVFPEGEVPAPIENHGLFGPLRAKGVPLEAFLRLTRFPIVMIYGDHVPTRPVTQPHEDYWRAAAEMSQAFADAVNRHGGDAQVIRLPEKGLSGNTHFMMSDLNNEQVAEVVKAWLRDKHLDGSDR